MSSNSSNDDARIARREAILHAFTPTIQVGTYASLNFGRGIAPETNSYISTTDLKFVGAQPDNIRSGQTYYLNLQLGESEQAMLIHLGYYIKGAKDGDKNMSVIFLSFLIRKTCVCHKKIVLLSRNWGIG